jgi:hypothetical protein
VFLPSYVNRPALPSTLVAFNGGSPLFAGAGEDDSADLTKPFDVEIALTGSYKTRNFELAGKQFDEMIANHRRTSVDPAIDREHETWFSFPSGPAHGWVRGMRVDAASSDARRKALVATIQLNDLGQHAIRNGHYRYVSIGFDKAAKDRQTGEPIGAALDHLALVKNPFIQGMRPLSLALSQRLGRAVEEEPMEQLAQQLRQALGLSAEATEEQIIAAFAAQNGKDQAHAAERTTLANDLAEQKRIGARLEAELERLSKDSEERATREWSATVDQAVKEFRLTPAESDEHKALTGAERTVAAKLLAKRVPNKPAPAVPTLPTAPGSIMPTNKGTTSEGLSAAQLEAITAYQKSNPEADAAAALTGAIVANPALFATMEG